MGAQEGERYTIRRQIFKLFGAGFHVYSADGELVAYCKQKAFRLREDIRLYTDQSMKEELLTIATQQIIDFSASYVVRLPTGEAIGMLRRKGMKSTFLKDSWSIFDEQGEEIASLEERGNVTPVLRRFHDGIALFFPQNFELVTSEGTHIANIRQHFNPFIYRLGIAVHAEDERIDDLLILAAGSLIAAIEGRQD